MFGKTVKIPIQEYNEMQGRLTELEAALAEQKQRYDDLMNEHHKSINENNLLKDANDDLKTHIQNLDAKLTHAQESNVSLRDQIAKMKLEASLDKDKYKGLQKYYDELYDRYKTTYVNLKKAEDEIEKHTKIQKINDSYKITISDMKSQALHYDRKVRAIEAENRELMANIEHNETMLYKLHLMIENANDQIEYWKFRSKAFQEKLESQAQNPLCDYRFFEYQYDAEYYKKKWSKAKAIIDDIEQQKEKICNQLKRKEKEIKDLKYELENRNEQLKILILSQDKTVIYTSENKGNSLSKRRIKLKKYPYISFTIIGKDDNVLENVENMILSIERENEILNKDLLKIEDRAKSYTALLKKKDVRYEDAQKRILFYRKEQKENIKKDKSIKLLQQQNIELRTIIQNLETKNQKMQIQLQEELSRIGECIIFSRKTEVLDRLLNSQEAEYRLLYSKLKIRRSSEEKIIAFLICINDIKHEINRMKKTVNELQIYIDNVADRLQTFSGFPRDIGVCGTILNSILTMDNKINKINSYKQIIFKSLEKFKETMESLSGIKVKSYTQPSIVDAYTKDLYNSYVESQEDSPEFMNEISKIHLIMSNAVPT